MGNILRVQLQLGELDPPELVPCPGPPARLSALSVSLFKLVLYGAFVWARGALTHRKRRFRARADRAIGLDRVDTEAHQALAAEAAAKSLVLLQNKGGVLPLKGGASAKLHVALVGPYGKMTDDLLGEADCPPRAGGADAPLPSL